MGPSVKHVLGVLEWFYMLSAKILFQNRGLLFYYPPRPPPRSLAKDQTFSSFFSALFPYSWMFLAEWINYFCCSCILLIWFVFSLSRCPGPQIFNESVAKFKEKGFGEIIGRAISYDYKSISSHLNRDQGLHSCLIVSAHSSLLLFYI